MGIRDSRLQIVPGGDGPIFGATDAGVTRYALAFLEGDHSFTRQESHTGSFTPGNSMERVGTRWPEDRGYIESVRRRECAGSVRGVSRKRLSIALRNYDRDCHPSRRAGKLPKNDVGVRVALVVTLQEFAEVAELVDALDLGSSGETRPGSSPGFRMVFLTVAQSSAYAHYADKKIISPRLPCGSRHQQASNLTA